MEALLILILAAVIILNNAKANDRRDYEDTGLLLGLTIFLCVCVYLFMCFIWILILGDAAFTPLGLFFAFIGWPFIIIIPEAFKRSDSELPHKVLWKKYNEFFDSVDEWGNNNRRLVFVIAGITILIILFILFFSGVSL